MCIARTRPVSNENRATIAWPRPARAGCPEVLAALGARIVDASCFDSPT